MDVPITGSASICLSLQLENGQIEPDQNKLGQISIRDAKYLGDDVSILFKLSILISIKVIVEQNFPDFIMYNEM